ncbi:BlaI/MecI/CopY family transcriptional regulator [Clostridium sp.]|uniref:BlaI/MecI/CopY family transcriptional regulator n=1 Tax=Clostridium sp. TaxID=1506 RepID=UPI003455C218
MKVIWDKKESKSNEIIEELKDKKDWKSVTIKSLISRLLNKNNFHLIEMVRNIFIIP